MTISEIVALGPVDSEEVAVTAVIHSTRELKTMRGTRAGFCTLMDDGGRIEMFVPPNKWNAVGGFLLSEQGSKNRFTFLCRLAWTERDPGLIFRAVDNYL